MKGMIRLAFCRMLLRFRNQHMPQVGWTLDEILAEFDRKYGEIGKQVGHVNQYVKMKRAR
jgi:hypothetical protein